MVEQIGVLNHNCKLTEDEVRSICSYLENKVGFSIGWIARKFNLNYSTVRNIYNRAAWTHISEEYDFSEREKTNIWRKGRRGDYGK